MGKETAVPKRKPTGRPRGRPRIVEDRRDVNVSLPGWAVDRLRELGDGFPSRGILRVLYWYDDHGALEPRADQGRTALRRRREQREV